MEKQIIHASEAGPGGKRKMKECKFYSCDDGEEYLTCTDMDDAIQQFVDGADEIPKTLKVFGYNQIKIGEHEKEQFAETILEQLIENLDENYGRPDENTDISEEMKDAAKEFIEKIIKLYPVWMCEQVAVVEINMTAWCSKNELELMTKIKNAEQKELYDCHKCVHRREVPGDAHSRCNNVNAHVKGNPTGINGGWFRWPFNFDPTWLDSCDGFSKDAADKLPEHKADPQVEFMMMLRL